MENFTLTSPRFESAGIRRSSRTTSWCFFCILVSFSAAAVVAAGQSANLSLGSSATTPGGSVTLDLTLTASGSQPAGLQWAIQYSTADISSVAVSGGATAAAAGKSLACNPGGTMCLVYGVNQTVIGDGVVARITFAVSPGTTSAS